MISSIISVGLTVVGWFLKRSAASDEAKQQFTALVEKIQGELTWWKTLRDDGDKQRKELENKP